MKAVIELESYDNFGRPYLREEVMFVENPKVGMATEAHLGNLKLTGIVKKILPGCQSYKLGCRALIGRLKSTNNNITLIRM